VRWGNNFTANETASLKTSRLTWNFTSFTPDTIGGLGVNTGTGG